ncbi:hypothetical protein N8T08_009371 [Aspergillus melleus]|uniref:Uncharacterized protein n=1 Tax=Aspergillus melleus TaxID=138277 RepID=A0ACC3AUQ0_9EURO|nr:hypothetical protein N8T08_009371 [Aspergillus melleus]
MDLDIPHLAKLHFITEHTARHARLQEGQEPDKVQRDWYIQRAQQLALSDLQPRSDFDYEGILTLVYKKCYADMEQGEAAGLFSIGQDNFRDHLRELSAADWAAFHKFTFVGDEEDEYDTEVEDAMPDVEEEPLDYDPRGEEDPQIALFEKAVDAGMATLKRLRDELKRSRVNMDDTDWISEIDRVESYSKPGQVMIGVVGSTGVGKSSLINALVDEERILATDCMRASTAVATEIVYNNGGSRYKAEIQFVNRGEWEKELQALVWDLDEDNTGEIREDIANDSEAGAALAKIKAVYPWIEARYIMDTPVQTFLDHPSVSSLLGSEKFVEENKPQAFYRKVKTYLDSEGKGRGRHKKSQPYNSVSVWPLVRVVRIFVPAPALSTGAVLVDLPGLFDSNPARVTVAEQYMKRCSAHWVVAPINRAASDKVAKDLLGKNFKMHMQMKNAFSSITFICTKTDDISISETQDSLKLDLPVPEQREAKHAQLKAELKELHDKREQIMDHVANVDEEIEETEAQIDSDLKSQRKKLVAQRRPLGQEIKSKEIEIGEFEIASRNMKLDVYRECIQARNDYSEGEIKRDFARGIRDLEEPDETTDQGTKHRMIHDYQKLERDLPVFCVSARAYQKLRGRMRKEATLEGFTDFEETGVLRLRPEEQWKEFLTKVKQAFYQDVVHKLKTFAYFIKWEFRDLAQVLQKGLTDFHWAAIRSAKHKLPTDHRNMLSEALRDHSQTLEVELETIEDNFKAAQREINYVFPATIREELASTYKACAMEKGKGTFNRMKYTMAQKVADSANHIVHECAERVRKTLDELERDTARNLQDIMTMMMNSMKNDYYIALIEPQIRQFTAEQIEVRRRLDGIVRKMISDLQLGQLLNQK